MADFHEFYEGRVVEAELEAIRLRKDDPNKTMFWLWPPFGPTEERERELLAPKPSVAATNARYQLALLQQSYLAQQNLSGNAWAQQQRQNNYLLRNIFGGII